MTNPNSQQNKDQTSGNNESPQNHNEFEETNNSTPETFIESDPNPESHNIIDDNGHENTQSDDDVDYEYSDGYDYSEDDTYYEEGEQGISLEKFPESSEDHEFFETHYESHDPEYINDEIIKPADHSDRAADLYSSLHGVEGVFRENAQLAQNAKNARRQMIMSMGVNMALASIIVAMLIVFSQFPKTRYIPTTDNKAICEVTPENNPNITDVSISDFAKDAILNLYTFDYVNHEDQINASLGRWFSAKGRTDTIKAMDQAGITAYVKEHALTLRAGTTAAAKIEKKGRTSSGSPYWVVRFPMVVDVYSGGDRPEDTQKYMVSVRVIADDASAQNPKGLAIASAALEPRS